MLQLRQPGRLIRRFTFAPTPPRAATRPCRRELERTPAASFDHLVGAGKQRGRHSEAQRLRGRKIDDKVELGRLFDGGFARICPAENLIDEVGGAAPHVRLIVA